MRSPRYLPVDWNDAAWWHAPNAVHDVGEVHARWRREAARMRRSAYYRTTNQTANVDWRVDSFKDRVGL